VNGGKHLTAKAGAPDVPFVSFCGQSRLSHDGRPRHTAIVFHFEADECTSLSLPRWHSSRACARANVCRCNLHVTLAFSVWSIAITVCFCCCGTMQQLSAHRTLPEIWRTKPVKRRSEFGLRKETQTPRRRCTLYLHFIGWARVYLYRRLILHVRCVVSSTVDIMVFVSAAKSIRHAFGDSPCASRIMQCLPRGVKAPVHSKKRRFPKNSVPFFYPIPIEA